MKGASWRLLHATATMSLAVGVVYYWNLHRDESARRAAAENQVQELSARLAARPRFPMAARMPRPAATSPTDRLTERPADRPAAADPAAAPSPSPMQTANSRAMNMRENMRARLADPEQRRAMLAAQRTGLIQTYGDLLKRWQLPADKVDRVLAALAEEQLNQMERMFSQEPGQRRAMASPFATSANSIPGLDVLTTEQLAQLDTYRSTLPERMALAPLFNELELARMPLTASQQDQLLQIRQDERASLPTPDFRSLRQDPAELQREVAAYEAALAQRVRERADDILNIEQMARYDQYMQQQRSGNQLFAPGMAVRGGAGTIGFVNSVAAPVTVPMPAPRP